MKNLLGGKGANLAEMCRLGITVPSGFTISTEACTVFTELGDGALDGVVGGAQGGGGGDGLEVTFDAKGPVAEAILTYDQSTDPASPHYADQTLLHARKQTVRLPFSAAEIAADQALKVTTIAE